MSHSIGRLFGSLLVAATAASAMHAGAQAPNAAAAASHPFAQSRPIAGRYIVVFKDSVGNPAAEAANLARAAGAGAQVLHVYTSAIKGFAAALPDAAVNGIQNNPNVAYVEQDQTVSLVQVQDQATWGLDRIDQADRPRDTQYHYNATGAGVRAFIIDTGIRAAHTEFTGRIVQGFTSINDGRGTEDCNGHGTHVSGTVGGTVWGVAKQVTITPVRVLDCKGSGSWSGVIAGVDWVANSTVRPAVANMSLGGGKSASMNAAVAGAVGKGVTMVVAAGNSNVDACNESPSSEPTAITVGAMTYTDVRAAYSNFGACVDIFAPGSAVTSAWNTANDASNTISGTSMASPHVAGVAALVAQANPAASPAAIAAFLVGNATVDRLGVLGTGSPNLLLYSLATGVASEPAPVPVAVMTLSGSGARSGKNWVARATVTVRNVNNSAPVRNVTVSGSFTPSGSASCVTDGTGGCTLSSPTLASTLTSTKFTVTNMAGPLMTYAASQNAATQITITKP